MSKRMVKCFHCKNKFYKDQLIELTKSKRVCSTCDELIKKDAISYKELIKYICDGFGLQAPTGRQLKTISNLKKLGYTYDSIQWIIHYVVNIEKKQLKDTNLDFVPYYAEKAKLHFSQLNNAKNSSMEQIGDTKVIENYYSQKANLGKTRLVDISKIDCEV